MIFALWAVEALGRPRGTGQPGAGSQNQVSKTPGEARETAQQVSEKHDLNQQLCLSATPTTHYLG